MASNHKNYSFRVTTVTIKGTLAKVPKETLLGKLTKNGGASSPSSPASPSGNEARLAHPARRAT